MRYNYGEQVGDVCGGNDNVGGGGVLGADGDACATVVTGADTSVWREASTALDCCCCCVGERERESESESESERVKSEK
jgi:hypothetical protein